MSAVSKSKINRAGEVLKCASADFQSKIYLDAMDVLSAFRQCHDKPLKTAYRQLQEIVRKEDSHAIFAKRSKRTASIVNKLKRYDGMNLSRLQDIGGCRAIVSTERKLRKIVRNLERCEGFKSEGGKIRSKDYLTNPKDDGYRSYHMVGQFPDENNELRNIEIQIRTRIQHYWATALEIVDLFTGQALKSNQGQPEWARFFQLASKMFAALEAAQAYTNLPPAQRQERFFQEIQKHERAKVRELLEIQLLLERLKVREKLNAYSSSLKIIKDGVSNLPSGAYVLIQINAVERKVWWASFSKDEAGKAQDAYIEAEKAAASHELHIASLVSTTAVGGVKEAYPNFFADSDQFIDNLNLIESIRVQTQPSLFERLLRGANLSF